MEESINLRQGNMNALEYFLKFTQLFMYAPSVVSKRWNKMIMFVINISDHVKEEYRMMMMHDDMNISRLMFYAQSIEESKLNRKHIELKRCRSDNKG